MGKAAKGVKRVDRITGGMVEGREAAARHMNSEAAKIGLSTIFGSCYKIESDVLLLLGFSIGVKIVPVVHSYRSF